MMTKAAYSYTYSWPASVNRYTQLIIIIQTKQDDDDVSP